MTTITVHRIDVSDLHTFRLKCGKCSKISIAEVCKWTSHGGRAKCIHCGVDWENAGEALAGLMASILRLRTSRDSPEVTIQAEIETGAVAPVP